MLTLHCPAKVDDNESFRNLLEVSRKIAQDLPIPFPIHPRSEGRICSWGLGKYLHERLPVPEGWHPARSAVYISGLPAEFSKKPKRWVLPV